jgi:CheY-like chemotaxis protein
MRLRVLVVEDDEPSLKLICTIIAAAGIEARGESDSLRAAALVEIEKFDGIFLDLTMPGLDGLELARRIRKSATNSTTPIAVISGRTERHAEKNAFAAGAHFFLSKPLDCTKLRRLLKVIAGSLLRENLRNQPVPICTPVSCLALTGQYTCVSSQISEQGMILEYDGMLLRGDSVQLSFRLPASDKKVEATGIIRSVKRTGAGQKAGCRFVSLSSNARLAVRAFVTSEQLLHRPVNLAPLEPVQRI